MGLFKSLALLLAATGSLAVPTKRTDELCMTADEAQVLATAYGELIANYSDALADAVLMPEFHDFSQSVNTLINSCPQGSAALPIPLTGPTFTSRKMFEIGQGQQPAIDFQQLAIWNSCNAVTIRWITTNTAPGPNVKPVIGLIVLEAVKAEPSSSYPWLINNVYSEFDAGAWLQNLQAAGICNGAAHPVPDPTTSSASSDKPDSAIVCSGSPMVVEEH